MWSILASNWIPVESAVVITANVLDVMEYQTAASLMICVVFVAVTIQRALAVMGCSIQMQPLIAVGFAMGAMYRVRAVMGLHIPPLSMTVVVYVVVRISHVLLIVVEFPMDQHSGMHVVFVMGMAIPVEVVMESLVAIQCWMIVVCVMVLMRAL